MGRRIQGIVFGKAGLRKRQQKLLRKRLKRRLKGYLKKYKHWMHEHEHRSVSVPARVEVQYLNKAEKKHRKLLRTIARNHQFEIYRRRAA